MQKNTLFSTLCLVAGVLLTPTVYAGKGMLKIVTDPGEAKIYINGKRKGTSSIDLAKPFTIKLDEGAYTIQAIKALNGKTIQATDNDIYVSEDSVQVISLQLKPDKAPPPAKQNQQGHRYPVITNPDTLREITDNYRSDPSRPNDFIPQGDGTVIDKRTGLQWMRCSLGQKWTGKTCSGEPSEYEWQDALKQSPEFAGYADWRLPTIAELETLVYCRSGRDEGRSGEQLFDCKREENRSPTIARQTFPRIGGDNYKIYWSSSPYANDSYSAWGVNFEDGDDHRNDKNSSRYVRLVRGGQ